MCFSSRDVLAMRGQWVSSHDFGFKQLDFMHEGWESHRLRVRSISCARVYGFKLAPVHPCRCGVNSVVEELQIGAVR